MNVTLQPESPRESPSYPKLPMATPESVAHLPGSSGPPVIGHTASFLKDSVALVTGLSAEHGPNFVMRMFGHPTVVLGSPDAVKEAFLDRDQAFSSHHGWDHAIGELFRDGLMLRDFSDHRFHRRIMQTAFRADALKRYLDMMNPLIEKGLNGWGREFKFYPAIKKLTLDLAADVFIGIPLDDRAEALNQAFVDTNQASIAVVKKEVPFLSYRRGMNGRRLLEKFFFDEIEAKRQSDGGDMFAEFCRATDEDGRRFTDREVVDHMIFLLMAAHDTTTSSLTAIISFLARDQDLQDQLREEVMSLPDGFVYGSRDVMPLCDWSFKEALRLHPPVPFIGRRTVKETEVGGVRLPVGIGVSLCSLVTHRMSDYWKDPTAFDPLRFSPERAEDKQHSHVYFPFGGGAHMCIGMHFAGLQVKAFLAQFLRRFRVFTEPGYETRMIPIPIPKPADGLPVRIEEVS